MRKTRIFVCALLMIVMISSAFVLGANAESSVSYYDGSVDTSWYSGGSTSFTLDTAAKFAGFVKLVNDGTATFSGKTVKLGVDIVWSDENVDTWAKDVAPSYKWTPIGTSSSKAFKGTFDGQGHKISGLYFYSTTDNYAGLFGYVIGATIKNVRVVNAYFDAYATNAAKGGVGGIVGRADSSVKISNCYSDAYLYSNNSVAENHNLGGIIGYCGSSSAACSITKCVFKGKVISENGCNVAGIVGLTEGGNTVTITECLVDSYLVGYNRVAGIVARAESSVSIQRCYTDCEYYIFSDANFGGILGGCRSSRNILIKDCFYTGTAYYRDHSCIGRFHNSLSMRVGSNEYTTAASTDAGAVKLTDVNGTVVYGKLFGTFNATSTFFTDKADDKSSYASANQAGTVGKTATVTSKEDFVNTYSTYFGINIYGDVYLKNFACSHDEHCFGEWIADGEGSQMRACLIDACTEVETRAFDIKINGAQVRFDAPTGIRFGTTVNKNEAYKALYGEGEYDPESTKVSFGTLILPSAMLGSDELTVNTRSVMNIPTKVILSEDDDKLMFTGVLIDIPETLNTYRMKLTARSYIKVTESGQDPVYYYSDAVERSFYDVGNKAYAAQTDEVKAGINMLVGLGCIGDDFYDENAQNVKILENATPELFEEYSELLEENGFTKYSENTIADNLFATYTNDKYIVNFYFTPRTIGDYTQNKHPYDCGQSMEEMQKYNSVEDADNIMRIIVDRKDSVDLPALKSKNVYARNQSIATSIVEIKPNNILSFYGMGYVIRLADGSFLMIDGGKNVQELGAKTDDPYDCDNVYNVLKNLSGGNEPVIAAWVLTHSHDDHVDMFEAFVKKYGSRVTIEQVISNFGNGLVPVETERGYVNAYMEKKVGVYSPATKLVRAHTGQKFYIRNVEMTMLFTMDDLSHCDISDWINNESLAFDVVIDGTTRIMFTGEVYIPGSRALIRMYGDALESDVLQMSHHGHFGATPDLYPYILPEVPTRTADRIILWPCGNYRQIWNGKWSSDNNAQRCELAENKYLLELAAAQNIPIYYYYNIGEDDHPTASYSNNGGSLKGGVYTIIPLSFVDDDNKVIWHEDW